MDLAGSQTPPHGTHHFTIDDRTYTIQPHSNRWMIHDGATPIFTLNGEPGSWRAIPVNDDREEIAQGGVWWAVVTAGVHAY